MCRAGPKSNHGLLSVATSLVLFAPDRFERDLAMAFACEMAHVLGYAGLPIRDGSGSILFLLSASLGRVLFLSHLASDA